MTPDPTKRFSARVDAYSRYRPSYPREVTALLERSCGLAPHSHIADIGCGTGLLAELFLALGCEVFGVEPNADMRHTAERLLGGKPRFHIAEGRAEATSLPAASVDFVTAGQAFHWFDAERARPEFQRILKPAGWLVLVWNERPPADSGFQADYDSIVRRYAPEITRIQEDAIDCVFGGRVWRLDKFPNQQRLDRAGLEGRLTSSSYAPLPGTPEHAVMVEALNALFDRYQEDGAVTLLYETSVYFGRIAAA
jgi:SAM-dependent methyltransferase